MTAIPQSRVVSNRLESPLRQVARRQWSVLAAKGVIQTLLASLAIILVALLIISFIPTMPFWARITAAVVVWGSVLTCGIYFLRPAMKRRSLVATAMDVERAMAAGQIDTQERITSSLELSQETDARFSGSRAMIDRLHTQAATDAAAIVPEKLIPAGSVGKLALLLIPLLAIWLFLAFYLPPSKFLRPLFNLLMPWQETPAFLSDIVVTPGSFTIAQRDPIEISVRVNPRDQEDKNRKIERAVIEMKDLATGQVSNVALGRVGPRDFKFAQPANRSFSYRITTDGGDSTTYVATVEPVPAIESLAVRYDYPAYTQLPSRVDVNKDEGAIDAIQGTRVTLTVTSAKDLTAASRIVVTEPIVSDETELPPAAAAAAKRTELPLNKVAEGQYEATHTVQNAGSYVVELINNYNRTNRERQERPITVHFDGKPQVTLTSPAADLTVRPTETVPVAFQASDDFGLTTVELMAQVEGGEVKATPVALEGKWPRSLSMGTPLSVANTISASGVSDAKRIEYWIRVIDNRAPDGQVAESNHQTLRLDLNVESLAARQDRQDAKDFTEAIRIAIRGLGEAHPVVDRVRAIDTDRANLRPDERRNVEDGKERLEKIASNLTKEANENLYGPYAAMAVTAKEISETRIVGAAGLMAKFDLHADQPDLRKQDATESLKQVSTAKKELEELLKKVEEQAKLVNAQHKLEDLARKQEEVAQQMAQQQESKPSSEQKSLKEQTQQVVNETPQLQNKEALAQAQALNELINEVTQLQEKQDQAIEQNQKQAELAQAAEEAKGIAEMQEALNQKIDQFKKEDAKPLEQAKALPPEQKQLENIVKDLNAAKLQQAAQQQMEAAKKLEQNAQQLEQQAKANPAQAAEKEQQAAKEAMAQAQQAMAEAKKAAEQAQQAAEQSKVAEQAAKEAVKGQQEAAKAEQQTKQASAEAAKAAEKPNNADAQKNAAQKAADSAMAAKKLADQAEAMAKEVQKQAEAAQKSPATKDSKPMQQAAKKAQDSAKKADDIADQAQAAADQAQQAAQQAAQAQQQKNADQAKTATAEAAKKAAEAGDKAEQAAKAAAEAGQQMAEAQKQAAQQAQAQAKALQQKADGMQQQAQAKQQAAEQAMKEQPQQAAAQQGAADEAKALAEEQKALAQQAQQQAQAMAEAQKQGAMEPKAAAAQQQQIGQQAQKSAQKAQQLAQQAEKAANANLAQRAEMAQEALNQAQAAQAQAAKSQEQGNNEQAAGAQEAAQNALARAEQALRGQQQMAQAQQPQGQPGEMPQGEQAAGETPAGETPAGERPAGKPAGEAAGEAAKPGEMAQGKPGEGQPGEAQPGEAQAGQPPQGQPGQGQPSQGQPAQQQAAMAEPHPGEPGMVNEGQSAQAGQPQTPQQAMQQAAQAAAEATAAQGQAAQGNQAAAQQAAQALAQAAQALAQAAGQGQPGQGQAQAQAPAPGEGQASDMPSPVPGQSGDPKQGIAAQLDGGSNAVPDAIAELGIHPGDWAKLGPLQQRELLNAAQQTGPPEYQAMIRNYYVRLARMQSKPAQ